MAASFMRLVLLPLVLQPLVPVACTDKLDEITLLQNSFAVGASKTPSLGDLTSAAAKASAAAAGFVVGAPSAPSLGDLTSAAASDSATAAGAPAELAGTLEQPQLRTRSEPRVNPELPDKTLRSFTSSQEADELEIQARAMDKELAESERLISEAWEGIRRAPILPTPLDSVGHHIGPDQRSFQTKFQDIAESVPVSQWYFFAVCITLVIAVDLLLLQHLPEIERTHVCLLCFWVIVAGGFCAEVWSTQGQKEGISWASGYFLEIIFSIENVFIFNLIFHTLETPRRLVRKALLVTLIGSIKLRFAFALGLADAIYKLTFLPFMLGAWLVYCGTQQVAVRGRCEEGADVTQTVVVRCLRWCLGDRLGEFYDEEGEAIILLSGKKSCITLLGVAVACLLTTDLFFGPDATLVKQDVIPNAYVSISSSVIALFTLRALFFVIRDILSHLSLARYCTGLILLFVGAEMMVARFTEVSGLMSLIVIINVIMLMAMFSAVKDSACPKRQS